MTELLLELFSEEIPARMQEKAAQDLQKRVCDALVDAGLTYGEAGAFVTPRRLCLTVDDLSAQSPPRREERRGPKLDAPKQALDGFLRSTGLKEDQLEIKEDKKGAAYYAVIEHAGRNADDIIAMVLPDILHNFPWPKSMRWGTGNLRWVRPLHSILCILSDQDGARVVNFELDGIKSGNQTFGHRFHAPEVFRVNGFEDYTDKLNAAYVVLSSDERREKIWHDASNLAFAQGLELVEDKALLAEVAGLVEWPVVLMGKIADEFLDLPAEVLQTSMREHQKFFSVRNPKTGRIEQFITVANRDTTDRGATILSGNQKVLSARLADAKFFWENDLRVAQTGMKQWRDQLDHVIFHNKLGTQGARITRIAALVEQLAPMIGVDAKTAAHGASLAKLDLSSQMVYEFPELQGIMGRYYALIAGESDAIAAVAAQHYSPLGPNDTVPSAPLSVAVALADKIDTLCGFWAIDEKPTGSKDPFALRRAALGIIRLILENDLQVRLRDMLSLGHEGADINNLLTFFHERLKSYLREQAIRHDVIDAVLNSTDNDNLLALRARARALQAFLDTDDGENLHQGFKRAYNIVRAEAAKDNKTYDRPADAGLADDITETALFDALAQAHKRIDSALSKQNYNATMHALAQLRAPIDAFFETVQVNSDNPAKRRNRLCLLHDICTATAKIAAFERLEG